MYASPRVLDVFVTRTVHQYEAASRRRREDSSEGDALYLSSAEGILLHKLEWFRMGGEVSERQRTDAIGIPKVQGDLLDINYVRHWAARLQMDDLLERALRHAG